jgi:hypothetical protein
MKPEQLKELADRIDHEQLWRRSALDRDEFTQEQRDRLDAGVELRRYSSQLGLANDKRKEGSEYMRGFKLERYQGGTYHSGCGDHEWHVAINAYSDAERKDRMPSVGWMYTAKRVADEVPRMIMLFEYERKKQLSSSFKMCGHDPRPGVQLPDNHLRCALGKECRACPHLASIDSHEKMTPEAKDEAKAWTCATHILLESETDSYIETFLRDKSDDAFDDRLAQSFSAEY